MELNGGTTTIELKALPFDGLDAENQERAREWYLEDGPPDGWYEWVFGDFARVCDRLGVQLRFHDERLIGGGTREEPNIYFDGFGTQRDSACYEGEWTFVEDAVERIESYAPEDGELHSIAGRLAQAQRENDGELYARVRSPRGNYMTVDVEREDDREMAPGTEDAVIEALQDLGTWLFRSLEREYHDQLSNETVDETIRINEWLFVPRDSARLARAVML